MARTKALEAAMRAAQEAGEVIASAFGNTHTIETKGLNDIVTETDKNAEQVIIRTLQKNTPFAIMTEESGNIAGSSDAFWVVDPIDGTTNFSRGFPLCGVSIALVKDGTPCVGVVFNPITKEMYWAEKEAGAYMNGERIHVAKKGKTSVVVLDCGYKPEHAAAYAEATKLLESEYLLRRIGTVALELCNLARGTFDGFADYGDMLWDYAGGLCIVSEAGGIISDWKGDVLKMEHGQHVLAASPEIHAELIGKISHLQR